MAVLGYLAWGSFVLGPFLRCLLATFRGRAYLLFLIPLWFASSGTVFCSFAFFDNRLNLPQSIVAVDRVMIFGAVAWVLLIPTLGLAPRKAKT